jgi:ABC-type uncharacterized transport system substrate-binding protein
MVGRGVAVIVVLALVAAAGTAHTQPVRKTPRLGVLEWRRCPGPDSVLATALASHGYRWDAMQVDCRSADGDHGRLADAAVALAGRNPDVIAALTHVTAHAAHRATRSTPIVMIASGDPVRTGLVASLARPGGNVTGLTYYATELVEKRLQLLKELLPGLVRVAVLGNRQSDHVFSLYRDDAERAARALDLQLIRVDIDRPEDIDVVIERVARDRAQALFVLTDPVLRDHSRQIAEAATRHRLPSMSWGPWFVEDGALAAYSADYGALVQRAAYYIARILKGARAADLPVEQPTRFELIINTRTAMALGLTVPPALLARADRLIQ